MNIFKKTLIVALLPIISAVSAQNKAPENWFNLDAKDNNVNGVSAEKAYSDLLKGKSGQTVIVAVIDGGVDPMHEDLKDVMWTNPGEIPNNGIDDDKNGFIDDIHGWNFLGGKDGRSVSHETLESTRLLKTLTAKFGKGDTLNLSGKAKKEFAMYKKLNDEYEAKVSEAQEGLANITGNMTMVNNAFDALTIALGDKIVNKENVAKIEPGTNQNLLIGKNILSKRFVNNPGPLDLKVLRGEINEQMKGGLDYYEGQIKYNYNLDFDPRSDIVKDNYADSYEKNYGNNDVKGPDAFHGTHVAGIIGASRDNNKGIKGVANNVKIMGVRVVPDGDERDKDVANGIIYAVDNGAQVINMSFGKGVSYDKEVVDKAVKYALKHDVLLVHAAGNSSQDNDHEFNYPTATYEKSGWFCSKKAKNWIEVGALSWKKGDDVVATFSNYGKKEVDVFAPGVDIFSTAPDGEYKNASGTSMASPVTAGVAALIRSMYPALTAQQVKECIEKSVVPNNTKVKKPGSDEKVSFSDLSRTGGTVNSYNAIKYASMMKGKKKIEPKKVNSPRA
jgi:cell wall-associated protease